MNQPNLRTVLSLTLLFHLYLSCVVASSKKILISDSNNRKAERDLSAQEHLDEAFEEQGYYLQRLFLEYGSNGTLTYEGLQNLLGSLGLGEVSVLEIRHGGTKHSSPSPSHSHPHAHVDHHHPHQPSSMPPAHKVSQPGSETLSETEMGGAADHSRFPASLDTSQTLQEGLSLLSNHLTKKHIHENCLNVTQLLWNFGLGQASHITPAHFTFLCPALLYQIDSGVCLRHTESSTEEAKNGVTFLKALGWASLALFVISLPSLLALGLAPLISPSSLRTFLCPMAAMAVGTLCGDALLHLLPHKSRKKRQQAEVVQELGALAGSSPPDQTSSDSGHSHAPPDNGSSGLGSVAWMVVMGDGIHNLTDGLAIGVAFSQSLTGGLSTTIAVFCHELPHELGDLAVLLAAGWPVRRLAVFSLLSALLGYVGVLGGTAMGHQWAQHSPWILTVTAGVFLYVALADMIPEMLHGDRGPLGAVKCFLLQCVGLLIGGAIMLCIALFEEDIAVSMGDC
ncbi:zinc transporter ZIP5 isoform X2 [Astyanax mexicanus]|uniref:zinc transporter ZIP5 isoform X2 n=1 Tax=Astyanax mexicanus TaxID=7994 RepID=UPI0020CB4FAA|nr:zinc transporter ZIP5 isoform X2 [Astyanax mexicanus]